MRQIILDTETTGLDPAQGNRIIEIGCIELINRRLTNNHYHQYINPERESEAGALAVHGITQEFLSDKPLFSAIIDSFLEFIKDAQLIIHNAPFDVAFLDHELKKADKKYGRIADYCTVFDTLPLAKQMHPGQRNSLDVLCKRYSIDNSKRDLHGALLDAELLAKVYLAMTGGQTNLFGEEIFSAAEPQTAPNIQLHKSLGTPLKIIRATVEEITAHEARIAAIAQQAKNGCLWLKIATEQE